jgi:hypothetical protein
MIQQFTGRLKLRDAIHKEDLNKLEFVLMNEALYESFPLTKELDNLLGKDCGMVIHCDDIDWLDDTGVLQRYNGLLMMKYECVDHLLLDLTGEIITVYIDDMVDCEDELDDLCKMS